MALFKRVSIVVASLLLASFAFYGCGQPQNTPAVTGGGDSAFAQFSEAFLKSYLDWRPQSAVSLGYHQFDRQVTDYSKASIAAELQRLKDYRAKLGTLDTGSLSAHAFIDYRILRSAIDNELFHFEDEQEFTKNPMSYAQAVDINNYIKRDFAPLEERVGDIIAVERQLPALYANAKANLTDSLAKPFIDMAIDIAKGNAGFLSGDLLTAFIGLTSLAVLFRWKLSNPLLLTAAAVVGLIAYPILQPTWVLVK